MNPFRTIARTHSEKAGSIKMPQPQPTPASSPALAVGDFPLDQLQKYRGNWIAFSADGSRIIASSPTLAALDAQVRTAGEDPEEVLLERLPGGESILSGSELS
jgi:hypothetical protein